MKMKLCCAFCKVNTIECDVPFELFDGHREFEFVEKFLIEQGWYVDGNEDEAFYDCGKCFDEDGVGGLD